MNTRSKRSKPAVDGRAKLSAPAAKNLVELFANSPFAGLDMDFERDKDTGQGQPQEKQHFFALADRLASSIDAVEKKKIKEELARMTFGA